jgi:uncharacterized phage protein (TIGR01671 family)
LEKRSGRIQSRTTSAPASGYTKLGKKPRRLEIRLRIYNYMREIKFRVWDKYDKCFIEQNLLPFKLWFDEEEFIKYEDENIMRYPTDIILMQYTGIKDKNGKEIYENDLITWGGGGIHQIEFRDTSWAFKNEDWLLSMITSEEKSTFEIIGNVFENPELLK